MAVLQINDGEINIRCDWCLNRQIILRKPDAAETDTYGIRKIVTHTKTRWYLLMDTSHDSDTMIDHDAAQAPEVWGIMYFDFTAQEGTKKDRHYCSRSCAEAAAKANPKNVNWAKAMTQQELDEETK